MIVSKKCERIWCPTWTSLLRVSPNRPKPKITTLHSIFCYHSKFKFFFYPLLLFIHFLFYFILFPLAFIYLFWLSIFARVLLIPVLRKVIHENRNVDKSTAISTTLYHWSLKVCMLLNQFKKFPVTYPVGPLLLDHFDLSRNALSQPPLSFWWIMQEKSSELTNWPSFKLTTSPNPSPLGDRISSKLPNTLEHMLS